MSNITPALATANMNSRIRSDGLGLSAREVWTQRDQLTGEQLPIVDRQLILISISPASRITLLVPSLRLEAVPVVSVGDLVSLKCEKYLVVSVSEDLSCEHRKFTTSQFRNKVFSVSISEC